MKSLLFITPELPYPAQSGGKLKSLKLLEHLVTRYRVTLACPLKEEDGSYLSEFRKKMRGALVGCINVPVNVARNAINLSRSYLRNEPLNVVRTASEDLKARIDRLAEDFDVVFLDHYEVFQYVPADHHGKVIYHAHNAYYRLWETYSQTTSNPLMKAAAWAESLRVRRYERAVCERADLVFAAPDDINALTIAGAEPGIMRETYHLGDDSQLGLPPLLWQETRQQLVYVGFLGWEANVRGLLWFINEVWPRLRSRFPELTLTIVGNKPDPRLVDAVERRDGIELVGFVKDLESVYPQSRVCIAPLTFGSGMKVKVLNAMARGIPVATTRIGAESIDARSGEHLMVAGGAPQMADQITALLTDQVLWQRLASRSRRRIQEKYTWAALFQAMDAEMDAALIDPDNRIAA